MTCDIEPLEAILVQIVTRLSKNVFQNPISVILSSLQLKEVQLIELYYIK